MCGITGCLSSKAEPAGIVESMTAVLHHRGPDGCGIWIDPGNHLYFGHQRLSIIDLSSAGSQPMHSACGRFCIIYNGEIYNADALRNEMKAAGKVFRGNSDTEVIIESCTIWGIRKTVDKLVGMFAFAVWDKQERLLYLVRDRVGIKPLYWGCFNGLFLFASELKSLREHPGWKVELDLSALASFMRHNNVPAPYTIYKGIKKLMPGSILTVQAGNEPRIERYWMMEDAVYEGVHHRQCLDEKELISSTEVLIDEAVRSRMIADVPLGAFLSGGIDSSTVVAFMQKNSNRPVKTFSIGYHEKDYNEAVYAKQIASHLGTEHVELYAEPGDALNVIPQLADIYDEPFADPSQIPTYLVSKLTRQHVTVALSGDGGDEVFAGYNRYLLSGKLLHWLYRVPYSVRILLKRFIHLFPPSALNALSSGLPGKLGIPQAGDKLYKIAATLSSNRSEIYRTLISHWDEPENLVLNSREADIYSDKKLFLDDIENHMEQMQYLDTVIYLPDDILTKVDRASMAVSLEARVPLLDHRVIKHAWSLPPSMKIRNNTGKWILRQILYKHVPEQLIERPKMGFAVPIDEWLRGPIRDWAESLLDRKKLNSQGYLNADLVHQKWREHQSGKRNWQYPIWNVLMFQAWHERWMG